MVHMSEELHFTNRDGVTVAATLERPDASGQVPAVLICQGLSGLRNLVLPEVAGTLADAGFASLRFDYAGYGESGGSRGWIDPDARVWDARFALEVLLGLPGIDPGRVGVYGHSYGGPIAISVGASDSRVRAVVAVSGPGPGPAMMRAGRTAWEWLSFRQRLDSERSALAAGAAPTVVGVEELLPFSPAFAKAYAALKESQGGTSALGRGDGLGERRFYLSTADRMLAFRPDHAAAGLGHCPALLINGRADDLAVPETVEPVFDAIPGVKRWILVPGADHNTLDSDPGLGAALTHVTDWFATYLP